MNHIFQDMILRTRALRQAEETMRRVCDNWGYDEVILPTLLPYESLRRGQSAPESNTHKLIDENGRILVLRPDMTAPIAEWAATEWGDASRPLRVSYFSTLFRRGQGGQGGSREYFQAGVELIGSADVSADAEVLGLACEALEQVGVRGFQINVGHNGLLRAITQRLGLRDDTETALREALQTRDIVGVQSLIQGLTLLDNGIELLECLLPFGDSKEDPETLLSTLEQYQLPIELLEEIRQIFRAVARSHPDRSIRLDVSLVRDLEYYTGPVFEIYCPATGAMLGGGGRYDGLISLFGPSEPATGLALDLEQIVSSLSQEVDRTAEDRPTFIALNDDPSDKGCWERARRLRSSGCRVVVNRVTCGAAEAEEHDSECRGDGIE